MRHCPNADCSHRARHGREAEYVEAQLRCVHCGEATAAGGAPSLETGAPQWQPLVEVASWLEPHEVHLMRALLEQEGIAATVRDEFLAGVAPHTSLVTGGARVVVPPEDAERAAAVLRANRSLAALREAPGSHPLDERCPRCGSASLERERRGRMGALWTTLLLGVPLLLARERLRCQACDYRYSG